MAKHNPFAGLHTSADEVDLEPLIKQKDELVTGLRNSKYVDLIDDYGFELIKGEAKFVDEKTIEVNGMQLSAKRFLIAAGASPSVPNISGLDGVDYLTSITLLELKKVPKRLTVIGSGYIGKKRIIEADQLLVATGRTPNTSTLNLKAASVDVGSRGEIFIDDYSKTTNPRIYAAGDVTLGPQFVYVAAYQGGVAAGNVIGGLNKKLNLEVVPGVTFTAPAIVTVGLTEQQAREKGYEVKTSVLPLDAVPSALVNRETTGVFKLVADAKTL